MKCKYAEHTGYPFYWCQLKETEVLFPECEECPSYMVLSYRDELPIDGVKLIDNDELPQCARFPKEGPISTVCLCGNKDCDLLPIPPGKRARFLRSHKGVRRVELKAMVANVKGSAVKRAARRTLFRGW